VCVILAAAAAIVAGINSRPDQIREHSWLPIKVELSIDELITFLIFMLLENFLVVPFGYSTSSQLSVSTSLSRRRRPTDRPTQQLSSSSSLFPSLPKTVVAAVVFPHIVESQTEATCFHSNGRRRRRRRSEK
jgi:hypothetical protein